MRGNDLVIKLLLACSLVWGCKEEKSPSPASKPTNAQKQPADEGYIPPPPSREETSSSRKCSKPSTSTTPDDITDTDDIRSDRDDTSTSPSKTCSTKTPSEITGGGGLGGLLGGLFGGGGFDIMELIKMVPKVIDAIADIIGTFTGGGGGLSSSGAPASDSAKK